VKQVSPKDFAESSRVRGKIVNGESAEAGRFPWQVSLRAFSERSVSMCGGSIISNEYILTAAHCTKGYKKFEIGFGSNLLQSPIFRVVSFKKIEHAAFDSKLLSNDIAIIKLPVKIPFNKNVQPIKLPAKSSTRSVYLREKVTVSGFGRTSDEVNAISQTLNFVDLKVISNSECADIFGSKIVTNKVICAKGIAKDHHNTGAVSE
jgi:secreted trypsin-like serine protease